MTPYRSKNPGSPKVPRVSIVITLIPMPHSSPCANKILLTKYTPMVPIIIRSTILITNSILLLNNIITSTIPHIRTIHNIPVSVFIFTSQKNFQTLYFNCIKLDIHAYTLIYVLESGDMNVLEKQRKKRKKQAVF